MAFIDLGVDEQTHPGINGPLAFRPETAKPLGLLADTLLRAENSLGPGERELIAARVSSGNECTFCTNAHSAFAAAQLDGGHDLVRAVREDLESAPVTEKQRALLRIADATREFKVTQELVDAAKAEGATDVEVHDTVLIAAAFCMYNRYVEGLGTFSPADPTLYDAAATATIEHGYSRER